MTTDSRTHDDDCVPRSGLLTICHAGLKHSFSGATGHSATAARPTGAPETGTRPSRNDPERATEAPAAARRAKASRDGSARASKAAPVATGIEPRPQKLAKKKATAVIDTAELVRDPEHRDNHRWILRSGNTVIGYVEPSYGGASQSGRNGWISRLGGTPGPRCRSRDGAAVDLAARWVRVVTAAPKRHITGSY